MTAIADLLDILDKPARIAAIIGDELRHIKEEFGDRRRSEIVTVAEDISIEDLIAPQDMVVTFSHGGYVKSQPLADYRAQRRGGRGRSLGWTRLRAIAGGFWGVVGEKFVPARVDRRRILPELAVHLFDQPFVLPEW
jgi:hypothetical protein